MELRLSRWGDCPLLSGWLMAGESRKIFKRGMREAVRVRRKEHVMTEAEAGVMHFEDGARGHQPRDGSLWK